ncbi:hypothetical protein FHU30_002667 [Actinomadura rupiterrae]|nr:hypothetical protein [Actinomadura rupiterrae]MCP2337319.1 hypothetical protein [Actinomadura rupiterrae]
MITNGRSGPVIKGGLFVGELFLFVGVGTVFGWGGAAVFGVVEVDLLGGAEGGGVTGPVGPADGLVAQASGGVGEGCAVDGRG